MPRIADEYLDCPVYLYPSVPDAEQGTKAGGTGFLVAVIPPSRRGAFLYVVTNRHVVDSGGTVVRINRKEGGFESLDTDEREWVMHPNGDDLAAYHLLRDPSLHRSKTFPSSAFLSKELIEQFAIGPGDETFIVGRFVNHEGRQTNTPSVRFGNIAQMPTETIRLTDASGMPFDQECFLVEARSIPGYSGSPVFVQIPPGAVRPGQTLLESNIQTIGPWLLGVDCAHLNNFVEVKDNNGNRLDFRVQSNSGMMVVIPAWRLEELLNVPRLKGRRDEIEAAVASQPGATSLGNVPDVQSGRE